MLRILLTSLIFTSALLFTEAALAAKTKLPAWDAFVSQFIETYLSTHPGFAANAGRHEFDGKLPNWSHEGLKRQQQWLESERRLAANYPETALTTTQVFEQQYLLATINTELFWLDSAQAPSKNPMFYSGALDPNFYISRPYAPPAQRMRAFIKYAGNIPQAAKQIRANLQPHFPSTYINIGMTVFDGLAKFYAQDATAAFASVNDPQLQQQFAAVVPAAAKAMQELAAWLGAQRPRANNNFALGIARFQEMLKATEGVDLPLETLEKMGREDLERNLVALQTACQQYAPEVMLEACVEKVQAQKPAGGPINEARSQLSLLKAFLLETDMVSIPGQEEAGVAESPPFNRWNSAYIDIPGPFEPALPAVYYVAPPDPAWTPAQQAAYIPGKANLLFISAHEVWPGHFLQHLHAVRVGSKFGQLFSSYAYSEGWAHYTEELMWEAGLNAGDAETHIGQLLNALLRDVRFLSAIGLHTQGMPVATAEKMFRELAFQDAGNARQQAARGTFDPAYLNYTLGKLMIRKLRDDWTASRGGRAAWKIFHDAFLSYGAPPIPLVRKAMLGEDGGPAL
jgi:hypothetical protein